MLQNFLTPQAYHALKGERVIRQARPGARLALSPLLEWQARVIDEAARVNVVCVGRRAGKTELGLHLCADDDVLRHPVGWFAPSYKMMLEVWRSAELIFSPIIARRNAAERRIEFTTGGVLEFWSLDNPLAGRGRKYRRIIVDEAAFIPNLMHTWEHVLRPTLADYRGDAWLFSTPKGRNGFYYLWQRGQGDVVNWRSWQLPSEVNPTIPPDEFVEMRATLPERVIAQELDAMFLDDAGGVFRRVMEAATGEPQDSAILGHQYVMAVDWGRSHDFSVIAVIDMTIGSLVSLDRFNQIDYTIQRGRVIAAYERFRPEAVIVEVNAMGQPIADELLRDGLPVVGFMTRNANKALIIDALAMAFERGDIRIIPDPVLIGELQAYEGKPLAYGLTRYSAPDGMHDDTVMALAMAWHGATDTPAVVEVTRYDERIIQSARRQRPR